MKIIIAGAGDVGFHLAELLAFENQDIVLIDTNQDVLDYAETHLDVMTLLGDSSSVDVLEQADVSRAKLVLAVTTSEKNNLVTAILAKKMGARQAIARVQNDEYLRPEQKEMFRELGIDSLISPRQLAAREIQRLVNQCSFTDIFEFEGGKISLVGITLDEFSPLVNKSLYEIGSSEIDINARPIAVLRGHQTIIPRGRTILRRNDHVYFITKHHETDHLEQYVGKKKVKIRNIMVIGGTGLAYDTARLLEDDYNVTLVEMDKERCKRLAEHLQNTLIIHGDPSNIDLLEEEGLNRMDAFIALTRNSEANIIASLTAKNHGVYKTIAQVENKEYVHISQNIGVDTLINKKLIAANNIFRFVRKGQIEAITSLNGVDAEVIEFVVHKSNQLTRKPLKELHFPETALIGGVIRGEESLIPTGEFQLQLEDKVIVFAMPEAIGKVERLFR
ncbi:MAG: Trk system potassium transporter TrkA [Saprospiraceae bacterium]|nr:Trk system potassium transporter TrkA [Saprospiraceae bacterium]MCB0625720.1 Trk system potassium transporter TrkA [Saprospiraceae bacterium]MCB0678157.1 Trk system potassium transporter TrkA [Saprospiraceae bacterium]MCB0682276.1 Trk system potassium transporter TrkA [Saprospiraceae bacterium]